MCCLDQRFVYVNLEQNAADVNVQISRDFGRRTESPLGRLVYIASTIDLWSVRLRLDGFTDEQSLVTDLVLPAGVLMPVGRDLPLASGPYPFRLSGASAGASPARIALVFLPPTAP